MKEKLFSLSPWQKEARRKVRKNPNITVEDLTEWFGCNNFGYFPKISELRSEIRKAGEE